MQITIQVSRECPHRSLVEERVRAALSAADASDAATVQTVVVEDGDSAPGFRGSPTILINGDDPFNGAPAGRERSCRVYRTEHGLDGAPSIAALRRAIEEATRGLRQTAGGDSQVAR